MVNAQKRTPHEAGLWSLRVGGKVLVTSAAQWPIGSKDYRTAAVRENADIDRVDDYHADPQLPFVVSFV